MSRPLLLCIAWALLGCGAVRPPNELSLPSVASDPPKSKSPKSQVEAGQAVRPGKIGQLTAGVAKVEITNKNVIPANDPLFVKALVLRDDDATAVMITLDAGAIGENGPDRNDYLSKVRTRLQKELKIAPKNVLVNASHCHGIVCADVDEKTVEAVAKATAHLVPVRAGV